MTLTATADLLRANDKFLIVTHIRPDGDTIGSGAALCRALRKAGKTAYLYNNPQFEDSYAWLAEPYLSPADFTPYFTICVDMADASLYPLGFSGEADLCVDHHPSNSFYAKETLLQSEKSSCGEIVLALVKELCPLDSEIADLLYVAISTDTGCFSYGNTTGETLAAAAELCFAGARNTLLNKLLFRTSSKARLALEAMILGGFRYFHEGKTVVSLVTHEMMTKAGAVERDIQDISGLPGRVEGAHTSLTIKEINAESCKISVRTNGMVDANKLCKKFGGGGHKMAAGCSINQSCEEAVPLLIAAIEEQL